MFGGIALIDDDRLLGAFLVVGDPCSNCWVPR